MRILLTKAVLIAVAIFTAVFLTVLLINNPNTNGRNVGPRQLEWKIRSQINIQMRMFDQEHPELADLPDDEAAAIRDEYYNGLVEESGINLPFLTRHLFWTLNALTFDWGRLSSVSVSPLWFTFRTSQFDLNTTLLTYLPFSVLLAVSSFALILLLGVPLALICTRHYGSWIDKLISLLAPLSSIPSWVMGIILIAIFAIELRILPMGGILDTQPPVTNLGYIPIILKHLVLPAAAIFLTNIFQLAYSWRTYFLTFSSEDYVELGRAKGLSPRALEKNYLLRPSLPYVITSFSLMFLSYWQVSMALEVIFDWKGIGWLYIKYGLPNFFSETMYPGELLIALSMVVVLAYLLGITVFLLEIVYLWVDPRMRFGQSDTYVRADQPRFRLADLFSVKPPKPRTLARSGRHKAPSRSIIYPRVGLVKRFKTGWEETVRFFKEVKRYPTGLIGLFVILFLLAGSIYAVTALPYDKIGEEWGRSTFTGQPDRPKLAQPTWVNWFREKDFLSTISLSTRTDAAQSDITPYKDGFGQVSYTLSFNYDYAYFPSEVLLYVDGIYDLARPFVSMEWITPDGRTIPFHGLGIEARERINLGEILSVRRILKEYPALREWYVTGTNYPTPAYYLLFANPYSDTPEPVAGTYQLVITGTTFEAESDIEADLYIFGQVYGLAGTDAYRRDLTVPLLWGMPSALLVGLSGSILTGILSMLLAATGAWYGGWVDSLVQRATEINLILPVLAVAVLGYAYLGLPIWAVIGLVILSNVFGTPTKNFRAGFLQIRSASYVEAAQVYGASGLRIILHYLMPRIINTLIPQIILLIPYFVFLEATLGLFNISSNYPSWGKVIYQALTNGAWFGSRYWALQPIVLLMITGLGFSMFGIALEKILNPRLSS